jgi:hypothetical protein
MNVECAKTKQRGNDVLAEKKYIHGTEIELVEERQGCESFFGRVHTGVELLVSLAKRHMHAIWITSLP